jgi:hypothetical protein
MARDNDRKQRLVVWGLSSTNVNSLYSTADHGGKDKKTKARNNYYYDQY